MDKSNQLTNRLVTGQPESVEDLRRQLGFTQQEPVDMICSTSEESTSSALIGREPRDLVYRPGFMPQISPQRVQFTLPQSFITLPGAMQIVPLDFSQRQITHFNAEEVHQEPVNSEKNQLRVISADLSEIMENFNAFVTMTTESERTLAQKIDAMRSGCEQIVVELVKIGTNQGQMNCDMMQLADRVNGIHGFMDQLMSKILPEQSESVDKALQGLGSCLQPVLENLRHCMDTLNQKCEYLDNCVNYLKEKGEEASEKERRDREQENPDWVRNTVDDLRRRIIVMENMVADSVVTKLEMSDLREFVIQQSQTVGEVAEGHQHVLQSMDKMLKRMSEEERRRCHLETECEKNSEEKF
jgi:hypothetical protein